MPKRRRARPRRGAAAASGGCVASSPMRLDSRPAERRGAVEGAPEVPADFHPRPVDGEVERFELLPLAEVAELVRDTERFKFNCNLVILDFLVRHGWFRPEDPDYLPLVAGLHRALPDLEGVP